MKSINTNKNLAIYCFLFLLSINLTTVYAKKTTTEPAAEPKKYLSFSLSGGMGSSAGHHMITDLNAELLFALSRQSSLGLGIGYITDRDPMTMHHHTDGPMDNNSDNGHSFSILPISLTFHYRLPVNEKFYISLMGGGGLYAGWFKNVTPEQSFAYGPHAGIGVDYKIANDISLIADGFYRYVLFDGFDVKNFSTSLNKKTIANPLHDNDGFESPQNNANFSGFGFRLGIRFDL